MTQGNQTYSVLTRERPIAWRRLYIILGSVFLGLLMGEFFEGCDARIARDKSAQALTYEDGLALANARLRKPLPKSAREEVEAMVEIAWRESRFDPKMQNPNSSSHGLYGFLDSTYRNYGGKTNDPMEQTRMALRYTYDRYGGPVKALEFWRRNGWY